MTDLEVLEKAFEKARKGGWLKDAKDEFFPEAHIVMECGDVYGTIFSHDFAKAFFGEEEYVLAIYPLGEYDNPSAIWHSPEEWKEAMADDDRIDEELIDEDMPAWKYHLQKMVLEKNPIQYLAQFV